MKPTTEVLLRVERADAALLALYLRRVTFHRVLAHCDDFDTWPPKSDQCYEMIRILSKLERSLDEQR